MDIKALETQFRGEISTPGSPYYDASRRIWNAMVDRLPAAIAHCTGPADVSAAVRFSVEQDIYPAIHGGGHNAAGLAMVDDGLVIDVSRMKGIFVDRADQTATAQTGLTWGEFDRETQLYGLANNRRPDINHRHRRTDSWGRRRMADGALRPGVRQHACLRRGTRQR